MWDIDEGITDPVGFFRLLPRLFPDATTLYVEGSSIVPSAKALYERFAEPGPYLPARGTYFPASSLFRCRFSADLAQDFEALAEQNAQPELADHLFLYRDALCLIAWHDAFANAILLADEVPEPTVAAIAAQFGVKYGPARFRE